MTRYSILADALKRQLEQHGISITDAVARDCAANAIMALDEHDNDPMPRTEIDRDQCWRPTDDGGCWDFSEEAQP